MNYLKLTEEQKTQLEALEHPPHTVAEPVQAADGFWYLGADLLTDCEEGQTYDFCREFLKSLAQVDEPMWKVENLDP